MTQPATISWPTRIPPTELMRRRFSSTQVAAQLSQQIYSWAQSLGLANEDDRAKRHAAIHAARLIAMLRPELSEQVAALVGKLAFWLSIAREQHLFDFEHTLLDAPRLDDSPLRSAATVLRRDESMLALELPLLREVIQRNQPLRPHNLFDDIFQWTSSLLSACSHIHPAVTTHTTTLELPSEWRSPINPFAREVEREVEAWLRDINVIHDDRTAKVFDSISAAEYAGWPCASAGHDELLIIMGFFCLWIFHDDDIEGAGTKDKKILARAVSGNIRPDEIGNDRYLRGWAQLGWRLKSTMGQGWLSRHQARFFDWVMAVSLEARVMKSYRLNGALPSVKEYFKLRRKTVGMRPTADFIELELGFELDAELVNSPHHDQIIDLTTDILSIHNDLFAYTKDTEHDMLNLVRCYVDEGKSTTEAFSSLATDHDALVDRLQQEIAQFIDSVPRIHRGHAASWSREMQRILSGFARWHAIALRYSDVHRIDESTCIRVAVRHT